MSRQQTVREILPSQAQRAAEASPQVHQIRVTMWDGIMVGKYFEIIGRYVIVNRYIVDRSIHRYIDMEKSHQVGFQCIFGWRMCEFLG